MISLPASRNCCRRILGVNPVLSLASDGGKQTRPFVQHYLVRQIREPPQCHSSKPPNNAFASPPIAASQPMQQRVKTKGDGSSLPQDGTHLRRCAALPKLNSAQFIGG